MCRTIGGIRTYPFRAPPILAVRLRRNDRELGFITTVTAFNAPQNVTLEELRIESDYPLDQKSAELCAHMARGG
jgi:hypothetical protein